MIEVQGLCKSYGKLRAVDNVSLRIEQGRVTGLLGPNGAGKTTLMRILSGFLYPDQGSVQIAGADLSSEPTLVRARVGYVPENSPLYPELSPLELLSFVAEARRSSVLPGLSGRAVRAEQRAELEAVIEQVGIGEVCTRPVASLSRGFRQRVAVGAALVAQPPVLILDEPTSALDPNQVQDMRGLIRELGKERTVLVSSHVLSEIEAVCSDAVILHKGRVVGRGPLGELRGERRKGTEDELRVRVEFDRRLEPEEYALLERLARVEQSEPDGEYPVLTVRMLANEPGAAPDPSRLFDLAVRLRLKLRRLEPLGTGLGEVFRELTEGTEDGDTDHE